MQTLPKRAISALIAVALLIATAYYFGQYGLTLLGAVVFSIGAYEFSEMAFEAHKPDAASKWFKLLFLFFSFILLYTNVFSQFAAIDMAANPAVWGVVVTAFIASSLWALRGRIENEHLLPLLASGVLGFFYCALLPTFVLRLVSMKDGIAWFALLAAVVFAGDTFAYFGGIWLGKNKLMPSLSPSKTIAGSVSGLLGSTLAGLWIGMTWIPAVPIYILIITSVVAGFLAQNGDLFESLIKRVASVKDSGRIMPGHGGVLDRLDGIYFAAPVVFTTALFFQ